MIKVPISWLREYVDINMPPEELAAKLTLRGLEVGGIIRTGTGWDKVVVGEVTSVGKHPDADRLVVIGATDGMHEYQVVTGAMNLKVGDKFPLALPGAKLIDGHKLVDDEKAGKRAAPLLEGELPYFTVKPGKLRGVESTAVAVAPLELGVSEYFDGILVLEEDVQVGAPLSEVLGETILDIELSPNLGRALSIVGVAREVAAMTGQIVRLPKIEINEDGDPVEEKISVRIDAPDLCSRFSMMVIDGITIGESPAWMQRRLQAAGIRPISNIVDITNYVMLEFGQPLHAYDYADIHGKQIIVRRAAPGEKMETLDHKMRDLNPDILLVADAERGVCMAGVMGSADSEVKDNTTTVALEGAHWNPQNIRDTSRSLFAQSSEAAKRFERFVDPALTVIGVRRGIQFMQQIAGGRVAKGIVDEYPVKSEPRVIEFPMSEIKRLLGIEIPLDKVVKMLSDLEFGVNYSTNDTLMVNVPSYRNDVTIKADLVEEVARQYGYDKIPESRLSGQLPSLYINETYEFEDKIRDVLVGSGLYEVINYTIVGGEMLHKLYAGQGGKFPAIDKLLKLANPLTADHEYMRPTLLGSILETVAENRRFSERVFIFELGKAYLPQEGADLPEEPRVLTIALTGPRLPLSRYNPKTATESERADFFDLKGVLEGLLERLNIREKRLVVKAEQPDARVAFHPGRSAEVYLEGTRDKSAPLQIGVMGEIHPKVAEAFGLNPLERVAVAEIYLESLLPYVQRERYQTVTRLPVVEQDLSIIVGDDTPAGKVQDLIRETGGKLLTAVTLFDLYRGKPIPEGKKNLTFRLEFHPQDKTLTEEEVTKIKQKIEGRLVRDVQAETRG
jgi:phenylalanyl-tRNA synthetase beta chain